MGLGDLDRLCSIYHINYISFKYPKLHFTPQALLKLSPQKGYSLIYVKKVHML
jgi:hypothetical protein